MHGLEKDLETACNTIAREEFDLVNLKQECLKGIPDQLYARNGHCFFVEFKLPGEKIPRYQMFVHKSLRAFGLDVYVVRDEESFREVCRLEQIHT